MDRWREVKIESGPLGTGRKLLSRQSVPVTVDGSRGLGLRGPTGGCGLGGGPSVEISHGTLGRKREDRRRRRTGSGVEECVRFTSALLETFYV